MLFTSGGELAVNLTVDFFVSKVASYFFNRLSDDSDEQNKSLESETIKWIKEGMC